MSAVQEVFALKNNSGKVDVVEVNGLVIIEVKEAYSFGKSSVILYHHEAERFALALLAAIETRRNTA
jgi:hypothetical protein